MRLLSALLVFLAPAAFAGCDGGGPATDGDGDGDVDGDTDGDDGGDADGDADGGDGGGPIVLDVGDVVDLAATDDGALELDFQAGATEERYVAIVHALPWERSAAGTYEVEVGTVSGIVRNEMVSAGAGEPEAAPVGDCRSASMMAGVLDDWRAGRTGPARPFPEPPPDLGERRTFWVIGDGEYVAVEAEAVYLGETVAFFLDRSSDPAATIDAADLEAIASQYDETILPRERIFFGQESDIDENGLVFVVLSPVVHEGGDTVAYFSPCDLMEPGTTGCPHSAQGEVLYLSPPNVLDAHMGTVLGILETMAHETNHMIFMNTRYLQHGTAGDVENMYLLEGLAALAQDLTGYQAGNLFVAWYGLNLIDAFSAVDTLEDHGGYAAGERDGCLRGGAYLLMRYLYDQAGGDVENGDGTFEDGGGIAFSQALHNTDQAGLAGLEALLPAPVDETIFDFYTALAVTNRGAEHGPISAEGRWNYLPVQTDAVTGRQRGFDAYAMLPMGTPMTGPVTYSLAEADGRLLATGVEYLAIEPAEAGPMTLRVVPGELELRARLARIE